MSQPPPLPNPRVKPGVGSLRPEGQRKAKGASNRSIGVALTAVVVGMVGLSFASVPLYRLFCAVTGYGGTPLAAIGRLAILLGAVAIALTRFGLLAAVTLVFTEFTLRSFPLTTNLSAWYVEWALAGLAAVLALALYGFVTTLKGRRL